MTDGVKVPHESLNPETLRSLIEHFVLGEGTDYGSTEFSLDDKVSAVMRQLERGQAQIVYNEKDGSCFIVPAK